MINVPGFARLPAPIEAVVAVKTDVMDVVEAVVKADVMDVVEAKDMQKMETLEDDISPKVSVVFLRTVLIAYPYIYLLLRSMIIQL